MESYDYQLSGTVGGKVSGDGIAEEIRSDATISAGASPRTYLGNRADEKPAPDDLLRLCFDAPLTAAQQAALDAIVAAHDGIDPDFCRALCGEAVGRAPGAMDDSRRRFTVGARWLHMTGGTVDEYVCTSAAPAAATWTRAIP